MVKSVVRELVSPAAIDMQILELADEVHFGVPGRSRAAIFPVMRERGFEDKDVFDALKVLEESGCVKIANARHRERPLDFMDTTVSITTTGKDRLRHLKAAVHFNVRLPGVLATEVSDYARRSGFTPSAAAIQFIQEGVRRERFPGIDFRSTAMGRQPHLTGTGLTAWEVYRIFLDHGRSEEKARRNFGHLTIERIRMGVAYAQEYLNEMPPTPPPPPFVKVVKV